MQAIWQDTVIAESAKTIVVEGNHYFPPDSIRKKYLQDSDTRTQCPWKGEATYYHISVGEKINQDAAWTYPSPSPAARHIKNYYAFWKGVEVIDSPQACPKRVE